MWRGIFKGIEELKPYFASYSVCLFRYSFMIYAYNPCILFFSSTFSPSCCLTNLGSHTHWEWLSFYWVCSLYFNFYMSMKMNFTQTNYPFTGLVFSILFFYISIELNLNSPHLPYQSTISWAKPRARCLVESFSSLLFSTLLM